MQCVCFCPTGRANEFNSEPLARESGKQWIPNSTSRGCGTTIEEEEEDGNNKSCDKGAEGRREMGSEGGGIIVKPAINLLNLLCVLCGFLALKPTLWHTNIQSKLKLTAQRQQQQQRRDNNSNSNKNNARAARWRRRCHKAAKPIWWWGWGWRFATLSGYTVATGRADRGLTFWWAAR